MRISDWSSDVCSSDLDADQRADQDRLHEDQRRHDQRHQHHIIDDRERRRLPRGGAHDTPRLSAPSSSANGRRLSTRSHTAMTAIMIGMPSNRPGRSEEHTSELQSLMRTSYAVFCLKKKNHTKP